jgi:hypothetical protein
MVVGEVTPQLRSVLDRIEGDTIDQKIVHLLANELRRRLQDCEQEILDLEIKYGLMYEQFQARLEAGELGDPFSYPLEQDAMRWDDLVTEKKQWLAELKAIEGTEAD